MIDVPQNYLLGHIGIIVLLLMWLVDNSVNKD